MEQVKGSITSSKDNDNEETDEIDDKFYNEEKTRPKLKRQQHLDVPGIKEQYRIRSLSDTGAIKLEKRAKKQSKQEQNSNQVPTSNDVLSPKQFSMQTNKFRLLASEGSLNTELTNSPLQSCLASSSDLTRSRYRSVTFADEGSDDFAYIDDSEAKCIDGLYREVSKQETEDGISSFTDESGVFDDHFMVMKTKLFQEACSIDDVPPSVTQSEQTDASHVDTSSRLVGQDSQSIYSFVMERDFRYYFQHPYIRLFVTYFVIFCNFLIFAEDPVSHSHTESAIIGLGNVFSFVVTKYPPDWRWSFLKAFMWTTAVLIGMTFGKVVIHRIVLGRWFRLKMFRDDQGTWMIMFLTVLVFLYIFSHIYNLLLNIFAHPNYCDYKISAKMGITNESFMKTAACGTWLGDLVTAWMVTDMMLQDNLYPNWARGPRAFWKSHGRLRIILFWIGNITITSLVIYLIVSDYITWDKLNRDFVATTELSRAFLASFILVMDLLIVMQDWDFPHFVCDMDIKLPGLTTSIVSLELWNCADTKNCLIHITGKWFNYGIIFLVMMLDLNMWKNQIFYSPVEYGQYTGPDNKIYTVSEQHVLRTGNSTLWSYQWRSTQIDRATNSTLIENDMLMNSRYMGHGIGTKSIAFIPSLLGFVMLGSLIYLYGRFPPKSDETLGGRLKKRKKRRLSQRQSSWNKERSKKFLPPVVLSCTRVIRSREENNCNTATSEFSDVTVKHSPNSVFENYKNQCETFL